MKAQIITSKVFLLLVAISLALFCVLWYMRTIMEPPMQLYYSNVMKTDLDDIIGKIDAQNMEESYHVMRIKLQRYSDEELMPVSDIDSRASYFLNTYIPLFRTKCYNAFAETVWDQPEWSHRFIRQRISEMESMTYKANEQPITEEADGLGKIKSIIDDYDKAIILIDKAKTFKSLSETKNMVASAKVLEENFTLVQCTKIKNGLQSLPNDQKQAHRRSLEKSIDALSCGYVNNYAPFLAKVDNLLSRVKEYEEYYHKETKLRYRIESKQKGALLDFLRYETDPNRFSYYSNYKNKMTTIYNAIETYRGKDIQDLKDQFSGKLLKECDFNKKKGRPCY